MSERLENDRRFESAVEQVKEGLAAVILASTTLDEDRTQALMKYHLVDDVIAALASADQQ